LTLDHVLPARGVGVLEVGHVHVRARVEGVDEHLAIRRPGELDPALLQIRRGDRRDSPVALADMTRFGQEIRELAGVEARLALVARSEQCLPSWVEFAVQARYEVERCRG
jgi:hypothetical protein